MRDEAYDTFYKLDMTHWYPSGRRRILQDVIATRVPKPGRIADIGCGTGANFDMLAGFAPVVGVDFHPPAVAYCRLRGLTCTTAAGLPNLPFPDESFDLVCAFDVIEHVDDDAAAVKELLRICKRGGTLLLTVPAYNWLWSKHDEANEHKRRYNRPMLRRLFTSLPADILKLSHYNIFMAPPIILVRLIGKLKEKLTPTPDAKLDLAETPALLNRLLLAIFSSERFLLRHLNLPAGISVLCLARKR
jgi:SAM-dependent methyltransferase